jgi:tripartite-type tricarboxylate transporter receptor subunit TctC
MTSRRSFIARLCAAGLLPTPHVFAQSTYPSRPIRFVVPVAPGAGTDVVARQVSTMLNKAWNTTTLVDNMPGAGGSIGTGFVAKAAPDGYTMLFTFSTHYALPWLQKTPYDAVADFEPVSRLATSSLFMVTAADSPIRSVADTIAASKRAPGSIAYASAGEGTPSHMCGALLGSAGGIKLVHIPYKNGSQALVDTISGQVPVAFSGSAALPLVKGGKLRVLAVTAGRRSAHLPEVPTMREAAGIPGFEVVSPVWVLAPRGTAAAVVNRLSETFATITSAAEFQDFCASQFLEQDYQPVAMVKAAAAAESEKWRRLVSLTKA